MPPAFCALGWDLVVGAGAIDEAEADAEWEAAFWRALGVFALAPVIAVGNEVEAGEGVAFKFQAAAEVGFVAHAAVLAGEVDLAGEHAFVVDAET